METAVEQRRRLVDGISIPLSVSNIIHYYLLSGVDPRELIDLMDREKIFFFIRYILSKHLGEVVSFTIDRIRIRNGIIHVEIRRIRTKDAVYYAKGVVKINPYNSTITVALNIESMDKEGRGFKRIMEETLIDKDNTGVELRYYI